MKPLHTHHRNKTIRGFTLVEVIATLVVVGILAGFFIHFMGTALEKSWKSAELVAGEGQAEGKLEEILADYVTRINDNPDTALAAIKATNYGSDVTMVYIEFDGTGNETTPASGVSDTLKVTVTAPGHIDSDRPAEVIFSALASGRAAGVDLKPTWDRKTATCTNVYCHSLDGSSCHGMPPKQALDGAPHPTGDRCASCHGSAFDKEGQINPSTHVNGQVNF